MYAAVLAGGKGKRFWPASTLERPKQLLDVTGEGSMVSLTWKRLREFIPAEKIIVLTGADQVAGITGELPELLEHNIFSEPVQRNTAPSLALASVIVKSRGCDEPVLCCPSDHLIKDPEGFEAAVRTAERAASDGDVLVTFGIDPTYPSTGYGYIEASGSDSAVSPPAAMKVLNFREKPDRDTARGYIAAGGYYWNSGIFVWRPSVFIESWRKFFPESSAILDGFEKASAGGRLVEYADENYGRLPSVSVDYGILEKADNVVMVPASFGWSDVGSWDALFEILDADASGNVSVGDTELADSSGCLFYNPDGLTAAVGVDDLIVAVSDHRVLVCRKGDSQRVREILESLEAKGKKEHL